MVEALRASAKLEPVLVDEAGVPVIPGRSRAALPPKVVRGVRLRDGKCRWPGCDRRTGLQVHHLWPVSWGGGDDPSNLALACVGGGTDHHGLLAPNGASLLLGNPNQPDGLHLIRVDQLAELAELAADQARAKTEAA
jgi:HNH endonuclease